jgi:hypothetical protein
MTPRTVHRTLLQTLFALGTLTACGGGADAPTQAARPALDLREIVLTDTLGRVLSFSHRDHWHGFPVVPMSGGLPVQVFYSTEQRDADDHDMPTRASWIVMDTLPTEFNVRAVVQDTTVARFTGGRSQGRFTGLRTNSASVISFVVRRNTATLFEAPPLNFTVR